MYHASQLTPCAAADQLESLQVDAHLGADTTCPRVRWVKSEHHVNSITKRIFSARGARLRALERLFAASLAPTAAADASMRMSDC